MNKMYDELVALGDKAKLENYINHVPEPSIAIEAKAISSLTHNGRAISPKDIMLINKLTGKLFYNALYSTPEKLKGVPKENKEKGIFDLVEYEQEIIPVPDGRLENCEKAKKINIKPQPYVEWHGITEGTGAKKMKITKAELTNVNEAGNRVEIKFFNEKGESALNCELSVYYLYEAVKEYAEKNFEFTGVKAK